MLLFKFAYISTSKIISLEAIERNIINMDWITLVILLSMICLVAARSFFSLRFGDFIMLFATNKYMMLKGKEHNIYHPFNILLFIVNILSVGLLLYVCYIHFVEKPENDFSFFLRLSSAYSLFILAKFAIEKIISNIFEMDELVDRYLFHKLSYRNFIAIILLPISIIFIYSWWPSTLALLIVVGLVVLSNILVLIGFYTKNQKQIFSRWFYFIVYLCALEIAPYIILYKLFTR